MKLFVVISAFLAVAAAEANPWLVYGHPYYANAAIPTGPAIDAVSGQRQVTFSNGAVVPEEPLAVQAARAQHLAAKSITYATHGYGYSALHHLGKREADAKPWLGYGYGHGLGYGLGYGLAYGYPKPVITSVGALTTYSNGAVTPTNTPAVQVATANHLAAKAADYAAHGYGYPLVHHLGKREAEAEADPYFYYGLTGHVPVTSVGALTTYANGAVVPTDPNNLAATAAHLASKSFYPYGYHYLGKREAESDAEADPYFLYGGYSPVTHPVTSVGALTTYANGAVVPTDPANLAATAAHLASKSFYPYGYHYLGKREAESDAEADPYFLYGGYSPVTHPVTSVGAFTTYANGAVVPTDPNNLAATAAHLATKSLYPYGYGYPYAGVYYG